MIKDFFIIVVALWWVLPASGHAQEFSAFCTSPSYHQFDFWLGDWDVFDQADTIVGYNQVIRLQNGCVIQENWQSKGTYTGTSFNFYDQDSGAWNQIWIDNQGGHLFLKGQYIDGKMIMQSTLKLSGDGTSYVDRITWFNNENGTVRQLWEMVGLDGSVLGILFDGLYKEKNSSAQ